jgi:hypothetical protein
MKQLVRLLAAAGLTLLAPATARATYVDFTSAYEPSDLASGWNFDLSLWITTVDGFSVTVAPTNRPVLVGSNNVGFVAGANGQGFVSPGFQVSESFGFEVSFSEQLRIKWVDFVDYYRATTGICEEAGCVPVEPAPALGTYSVDDGAGQTILPGGTGAAFVQHDVYDPYQSQAAVGVGWDLTLGPHTFRADVEQDGSKVAFRPVAQAIPEGRSYYAEATYFGVRGIEVERVGSSSVPELSREGAPTGLALIAAALAIATGRRRRTRAQ